MPRIGLQELLVILAIIVVLFGATKLPALGRGLGEAIKNFKKGVKEGQGGGEEKDEKKKEE
jgi:sec-independent protein translocase protein TatA